MRPSTISPDTPPRNGARHARRLACAWLLLVLAASAAAGPRLLRGTVSHVSDGDSIWVRPADGGAPRAVRLRGIDAPELCQPHGAAARRALIQRALHQRVSLRTHGYDSYQRLLADAAVPGTPDLAAWMVAQGHAWSSARPGHAGRHAATQARARSERRGLWAQEGAIEPRLFRRRHGRCH